jgi:hypothetical protein
VQNSPAFFCGGLRIPEVETKMIAVEDHLTTLKKMARKIAWQNKFQLGDPRAAEQDIFQSGCEALVRYSDCNYFPAKSVRYYMLNELSNICWESRWYGRRTHKRDLAMPLDHVDETRHQTSTIEDQADARLQLGALVEAAKQSDSRGHSKHVRTLNLMATHGTGVKGERLDLPPGLKPDTYWYACRSLKSFAENLLEGGSMKLCCLVIAALASIIYAGSVSAQPRPAVFTLTWTDNSNNEDGFKLYRKAADGTFAVIGQVGANQTKFVTPSITANEGSQICFAVTAFNAGGESARNEGCGTIPTTAVATLPLNMEGTTLPEYKTLEITVAKPAGVSRAILILEVYDPDYPDEGDLYINGNGPIVLFGSVGTSANQQKVATVEYDIPLAYLVDGVNKLRFGHQKTIGYKINKAAVRFEMSTPGAPTALTIQVQ